MGSQSRHRRRFASLFCGCGGFDLGFVQAGFACSATFDIDKLAVETHRRNPRSPVAVCDLSLRPLPLECLSGLAVLWAGPPCQGFSTVGKRHVDDPRNRLLLVAGEIAARIRPVVFVAENVNGVASGEHRSYWRSLEGIVRAAGYQTVELSCDANEMGAAQARKCMVMLAWNSGKRVRVEIPRKRGGVLRDALRNIEGTPDNGGEISIMRSLPGAVASTVLVGF